MFNTITIFLIAIFALSFWLGFMLGKDAGLNEAREHLERLEKITRKK